MDNQNPQVEKTSTDIPPTPTGKKMQLSPPIFLLIGVVVGLIVGIGMGYFLFQKSNSNTKVTSTIQSSDNSSEVVLPPQALSHIPVCPPVGKSPRCHAQLVVDEHGKPQPPTATSANGPIQFQTAYSLLGTSSSGRLVAIIDAYDHPNIKSDLDFYSTKYGIALIPDCIGSIKSSAVSCFQKVDQRGGTTYPVVNSAWALEIALDVEVVHAVCPDCKILLVEADASTYESLMAAIDRAVTMGADVVSNSWGSAEFSTETSFDSHLNVPNIAFTFSTGDSGYGTSYPAASPYVTAVGGTSLILGSNNSYKSETAWAGAGSGCSIYESKPAWQQDKGCAMRMIADVAAVADPSTGAAVYNTVPYGGTGQTGWFQVGGTSLAAPIIASVYALKGIPTGTTAANSLPYLNNPTTNLHDIISGSNGSCSKQFKYLCTSVSGYDGPTGLGSPKGINAF